MRNKTKHHSTSQADLDRFEHQIKKLESRGLKIKSAVSYRVTLPSSYTWRSKMEEDHFECIDGEIVVYRSALQTRPSGLPIPARFALDCDCSALPAPQGFRWLNRQDGILLAK